LLRFDHPLFPNYSSDELECKDLETLLILQQQNGQNWLPPLLGVIRDSEGTLVAIVTKWVEHTEEDTLAYKVKHNIDPELVAEALTEIRQWFTIARKLGLSPWDRAASDFIHSPDGWLCVDAGAFCAIPENTISRDFENEILPSLFGEKYVKVTWPELRECAKNARRFAKAS
jgi:hypothetical protein